MVKIELKIGKLIFHSFLNIAQHFGQKMKTALFEEGGGGSLTRKEPTPDIEIHDLAP